MLFRSPLTVSGCDELSDAVDPDDSAIGRIIAISPGPLRRSIRIWDGGRELVANRAVSESLEFRWGTVVQVAPAGHSNGALVQVAPGGHALAGAVHVSSPFEQGFEL